MKTPPCIPPFSVDYHTISNLAIIIARKPALPDKRYTPAFAAMFQAGNTPSLPGKAELNMPAADKRSGGEAEIIKDRKLLRTEAFGQKMIRLWGYLVVGSNLINEQLDTKIQHSTP